MQNAVLMKKESLKFVSLDISSMLFSAFTDKRVCKEFELFSQLGFLVNVLRNR